MIYIDRKSDFLKIARENHFAIPAFNFSDPIELLAVVEAAQELDAPVMCATNMQSFNEQRHHICGALAEGIRKEYENIPTLVHLDHSSSVELCKEAIDVGYKSVMIDCSKLSLDENIKNTREVVEYAHPRDVMVEAEIGQILGRNEEGNFDGGDYLGKPEDARRVAEESGCDSLAIGIGNAHGFYKGKPKLHFEILEAVTAITDIPLVLHGGTGIPVEDVQRAIRTGISKVNVGTQLHYTYLTTVQEQLKNGLKSNNVFEHMLPAREAIRSVVKEWITICMADGKAGLFR
jgi:ketose-bisphosphate aldolase